MTENKGDQGKGSTRGSIASTGGSTSTGDRVCGQCGLVLPWRGADGALEACWCEYCRRDVKPTFRTAHQRATAFRNTLRELLKVHALPEQVMQELRACWERSIWTSLLGSDLKPFKTFDDFCRDPAGLGCDPAPVRAVLEKWMSAAAFALVTTPVAQQGRRTDRLAVTSSRRGDKSRPRRTDTRHRTIHGGPEILVTATGRGLIGKMNAEFLAGYAKRHPGCERLAALLRQLEAGLEVTDKAAVVSLRIAISNDVRSLKDDRPSNQTGGGAKVRKPSPARTAAMTDGSNGGRAAPVIRLLPAASAGEDARIRPHSALSVPPDGPSCGTPSSTAVLAPASAERRAADEAIREALADVQPSFVSVVRAWRQLASLLPNDAVRRTCVDLLHVVTSRDPGISDDDLYTCLTAQVGAERSLVAPSANEDLNP